MTITLCLIFTFLPVISSQNLIENDCLDCLHNTSKIFVKRIWFPLAPPEYSCFPKTHTFNNNNIIVEVACRNLDCEGISTRVPVSILSEANFDCESEISRIAVQKTNNNNNNNSSSSNSYEYKTPMWKLCVDVGEWLLLCFILLVLFFKERRRLIIFIETVMSYIHPPTL